MAKWYGKIGFSFTSETAPGAWTNADTERYYSGDIIQNTARWSTNSDSTNDDLLINNKISIVADPFVDQNFNAMRYVEFMGTLWKITNVEFAYPRLILTLGGLYNG